MVSGILSGLIYPGKEIERHLLTEEFDIWQLLGTLPGALFGVAIVIAMKWVSPKMDDISWTARVWFMIASTIAFFIAKITFFGLLMFLPYFVAGIHDAGFSYPMYYISVTVGGLIGGALLAGSGIWLLHLAPRAFIVKGSLFLGATLGCLLGICAWYAMKLSNPLGYILGILGFTIWQSGLGAFFGAGFYWQTIPNHNSAYQVKGKIK